MKRIRLDIGALTATPESGGSFMFFLYQEGSNRCLPVKLTPPQMHAVLSNFNPNAEPEPTIHSLFVSTLREYRTEMLEGTIIRDDEKDTFYAELLLFDGEKETRQRADFIDGVILARQFGCPIYIDEALMDRFAKEIDLVTEGKMLKSEIKLQLLKEELAKAVAAEDYERAAQLNRSIEELEGKKKGKSTNK